MKQTHSHFDQPEPALPLSIIISIWNFVNAQNFQAERTFTAGDLLIAQLVLWKRSAVFPSSPRLWQNDAAMCTSPFPSVKSEWKNTFSLFDLRILQAPLKPCNFPQTSPLIQRIHTAAASPERRIFSPISTSNWIKARTLLFLPDWKQASSINSIMRFSPNDCPIRHEPSFATRSFDFTSMCPACTSQVIMSELMSCVVIGF